MLIATIKSIDKLTQHSISILKPLPTTGHTNHDLV